MPTSILIAGIPITGTGVFDGFTYDKLDGWYGVPPVDARLMKRPNQPGAFAADRTTPPEATISVEGQYFGSSEVDALKARERLLSIYSDGRPVIMRVDDALRTTARTVLVAAVDIPWTFRNEFKWTIDMKAPDPRRYGAALLVSNTLALAGSGLVLPTVDSPASGLDFDFGVDFGTTPNDGRITIVNVGGTETTTTFVVRNGSMPDGVDIVNVATGERLSYIGPIVAGTTLEFDPRTQAVFVNGTNPAGRYLPNPDWWVVPAGGSVEVQFLARGPVTGTPTLDATTSPAFY